MSQTHDGTALRENANALKSRGAWIELSTLLDAHVSDVRGSPELANLRGETFLRAGRPRDSLAWLSDVMPEIERGGDRPALRRAVNMLGAAQLQLGDLDAAAPCFERAIELGRQDGDDLVVARATNNLGAIANMRAQRQQALSLYSVAVTAYQRLGNPMGLAESYHNMAITFRDTADLIRADECELRAIEFAREAENRLLLAQARLGRAEISFRNGDAAFAEAAARRAALEFASLPELIQEADALRLVGAAALAQGKLATSRTALEDALKLARDQGGALNEAEILRVRAELHYLVGDIGAMREDASAATVIFARLGAKDDENALVAWLRARDSKSENGVDAAVADR
jgi:tetratricopeptide (TPR) repeat protein